MYSHSANRNTVCSERQRASFKDTGLATEHPFQDTYVLLPFSFFLYYVSLPLSFFFVFLSFLPSFFLCQLSAVNCLDKLTYKFLLAPHHGWLPYQGQESTLQHLQHFIGTLSERRGRRGNMPVGWNLVEKLNKPCTVFDDRP